MNAFLLGFGAFICGALLMTAIRASWHQPYQAPAGSAPVSDLTPAMPLLLTGEKTLAATTPAMASAVKNTKSINSVCAICGMKVDPALPTALYRGQVIGFGCRQCPPIFAAEPDVYGPHFLNNTVMP